MARLRRILDKEESIVLRIPTAQERSQRVLLWGLGMPILALEIPYLFGFRYPDGGGFRVVIVVLAAAGLFFMLLQYWRNRLRIAVTERRILVRQGRSWRHYKAMDLREISGFQYDPKLRMLLLYGNRRVLEIPCSARTRTRIIVAVDDSA